MSAWCTKLFNYNCFFALFNFISLIVVIGFSSSVVNPYVRTTTTISSVNFTETLNLTSTYALATFSEFNFWTIGVCYFVFSVLGSGILAYLGMGILSSPCGACENNEERRTLLAEKQRYTPNQWAYQTFVKLEFVISTSFITLLVARSVGIVDISALLMITVLGVLFSFFSVVAALLPKRKTTSSNDKGESTEISVDTGIMVRVSLFFISLGLGTLMIFVFWLGATSVNINYYSMCAMWLYFLMMVAHITFELIHIIIAGLNSEEVSSKGKKNLKKVVSTRVESEYNIYSSLVYVVAMFIIRTTVVGLILGALTKTK